MILGFDARMAPRTIQIPISGRDRRAFLRELKRVEVEHKRLVAATAAAYAQAHRTACEEWNARRWLGGAEDPSPRIRDAIDAGCVLLEVQCKRCSHTDVVDLELVIWPREQPVHTLARALECSKCRKAGYPRRRPDLTRLDTRYPDREPPSAASRQR